MASATPPEFTPAAVRLALQLRGYDTGPLILTEYADGSDPDSESPRIVRRCSRCAGTNIPGIDPGGIERRVTLSRVPGSELLPLDADEALKYRCARCNRVAAPLKHPPAVLETYMTPDERTRYRAGQLKPADPRRIG